MIVPGSSFSFVGPNGPIRFATTEVNFGSAGSGYVVGDITTASGGTVCPDGTPATFEVTAVINGGIAGLKVVDPGCYIDPPACSTSFTGAFDPTGHSSNTVLSAGNTVLTANVSNYSACRLISNGSFTGTFNVSVASGAASTYFGLWPLNLQYPVTLTRSGSTVTATLTAGDFAVTNGMTVIIDGADQPEYNGVYTATAISSSSFSYTISGTPVSPATGTILSGPGLWSITDTGWSPGVQIHEGYCYFGQNGKKYHDAAGTTYGITFGAGDAVQVRYDEDLGTLAFSVNGSDQGNAFTGLTGNFSVVVGVTSSGGTASVTNTEYSGPCLVGLQGGSGTGGKIAPSWIYKVPTTLDPNKKSSSLQLAMSNLRAISTTGLWATVLSTIFQATGIGRYRYCEFTRRVATGGFTVGIATATFPWGSDSTYVGYTSDSYGISPGLKWNNDASQSYGTAIAAGSVIGMFYDAYAGTLSFSVDNVDQGAAFTGLSGTFCPAISVQDPSVMDVNFGAQGWMYDPPAGYKGWF